ncbi:MAG: FAD-dependent oxidoreductase [Campylobacter sp.]|nr:FAD-dependent oxidoreductase [Campylobacter sp.]
MNKVIDEIVNDMQKSGDKGRRDALKFMMAAPMLGALIGEASAQEAKASSNAKGKIVVVGGGLAGIATAAALCKRLSNPDVTVIEPNPYSVTYQAGNTLIMGGVFTKDDVFYETKDFMPSDAKWIKKAAKNFDPENKKVILDDGEEVSYDYLVVAMGVNLNYGAIEGLSGEITSSGDSAPARATVGKNGIYSLYFMDGAIDTYNAVQELIKKAKAMKKDDPKLELIFSDSPSAIKCGGAPKKAAYIAHDLLEKAGVRDRVNITFYTNSDKLFNVPEYAAAIGEQFKARDIKYQFKTRLVKVDPANKVATFEKSWTEKGEYDKDLEEYEMIKKTEKFDHNFEFLHVVPIQKTPDAVGKSPIGSDNGWVPVDKETLQHVKYKNIFALGDCAAVPLGKTGGSARKQYKVVVDNLIDVMEGKTELQAKYDGYTVCPLITRIGRVMFAEFDWKGVAPTFPLDPTQERWSMWILKAYIMKPTVMYGMLPGRL